MIAIPVKSEKYGLKHFFIDGEDFEKVDKYKWGLKPCRDIFYLHRTFGYKENKTSQSLHRYIMDCPPGMVVDHIDGNPLNNCRSNLRICLQSDNMKNRKNNINGTSKYKGVSFHKRDKVFIASIRVNTKLIHIGNFKNETEAAKAYNESAIKLHGEFARLNIIEYK